jgi:CHAT domain
VTLELLLVSSDNRIAAALERELQRKFIGRDVRIEIAADQADARERLLRRDRHLIISAADIAPDEHGYPVLGDCAGVELLSWAEQRTPQVRSIVFAEVGSAALNAAIDGLRDGRLRTGGVRLFADVADTAAGLLDGQESQAPRYLKLTIRADSLSLLWSYDIQGEGFEFRGGSGFLRVDERRLNEFAEWSRNIYEQEDNVRSNIRQFGRDLLRDVFKSDVDFWADLKDGLGRIKALDTTDDGVSKLKICFQIGRTVHPIFLEALYSREATKEFWMLDAPISRNLPEYSGATPKPLFSCITAWERRELNCLIIEANTSGPTRFFDSQHRPMILPQLSAVEDECAMLASLLDESKAMYGLQRIVRVKDLVGSDQRYRDVLTNLLQSDVRWDIVHYSGHSCYDVKTETGYLFLPPATPGDAPDTFEISTFAALLKGTRFLFLSGCESSSIDFLEALARCNVASAIGYRRRVIEQHAKEYAELFYRILLGKGASEVDVERQRHAGCLEHAFLRARARMYEKHPDEWIWANPVLLVQSSL